MSADAAFAFDAAGKVRWKPRRPTLPDTLICNQTEAMELLRRKVYEDAIAAGVLAPCVQPKGAKRDSKLFAVQAVQEVARRIIGGEYPDVERGGWKAVA